MATLSFRITWTSAVATIISCASLIGIGWGAHVHLYDANRAAIEAKAQVSHAAAEFFKSKADYLESELADCRQQVKDLQVGMVPKIMLAVPSFLSGKSPGPSRQSSKTKRALEEFLKKRKAYLNTLKGYDHHEAQVQIQRSPNAPPQVQFFDGTQLSLPGTVSTIGTGPTTVTTSAQ